MDEFPQKYEDFPAESLLAIYHHVGYQIEELQQHWEELSKLRMQLIGKYHELTPETQEAE